MVKILMNKELLDKLNEEMPKDARTLVRILVDDIHNYVIKNSLNEKYEDLTMPFIMFSLEVLVTNYIIKYGDIYLLDNEKIGVLETFKKEITAMVTTYMLDIEKRGAKH